MARSMRFQRGEMRCPEIWDGPLSLRRVHSLLHVHHQVRHPIAGNDQHLRVIHCHGQPRRRHADASGQDRRLDLLPDRGVTGGCVTAGAAPASTAARRARCRAGPPAHLLHGLEAGGKVARLSAQFVNLSPFRSTAGGSRPGEDRAADHYVMASHSAEAQAAVHRRGGSSTKQRRLPLPVRATRQPRLCD